MEELYRNPDIILKQIEDDQARSKKGRFKIFFGYAAGIGKTYAMLSSGHLIKEQGIDVVVGYIEPHARPETMALLKGLEVIQPKIINENNIAVKEFDIDVALERMPEVILVDELAHTNAKGSRHEKRYEDINELLNAGIDVWTTVNVQHIESLNDVIAGITGITVRERIPDFVFDKATQIEMVDLEPQELIERLKQGKVYRQDRVGKAVENFFTMQNLVALREIALRRMADWVNQEQVATLGVEREGAASEHILMCLSSSPSNAKVIRQAARMAKAFHGHFTAIYVETPEYSYMSKEDLARLQENTRLVEQLGAKVIISYGDDIVQQIAEYAKIAKVTKIVLGRTYTKRSIFGVKESFSERLTKLVPQLEIFLIPDTFNKKYVKPKKLKFIGEGITTDCYIAVTNLVVATIICSLFARYNFKEANLILIYILGVLMTSMLTRYRGTSIIFSIISVCAFNFFFTAPIYTFSVDDTGYIITFVVMLITAFVSSTLTQKVKLIAKEGAKKAYRTEVLLETSQKLQQANNFKEIGETTINQLGKLLDRSIYCYIGSPEEHPIPLVYKVAPEAKDRLPKEELAVAQWTYKNNKHAGATTTTLPGSKYLYLSIRNGEKVFGVVGIEMKKGKIPAFEEGIMCAMLNEGALAFEKGELIYRERKVAIKLEQEQLRANLLRSISHDLRTPLTSISGNAGMLMNNEDKISQEQKNRIYEDIYDDSIWLINLVENLLSVTRIENGVMKLNLQPELIDDVITESLKYVDRRSVGHEIIVEEDDDMLMANMDAKLIIQVINNLLDNAIKYTERGSQIKISTRKIGRTIQIDVADSGEGIVDDQKREIFNMFYTVNNQVADGRRGMGLGLALCKSIVNAHGGEIYVLDNKPKGTIFRFTLKAEEVHIK